MYLRRREALRKFGGYLMTRGRGGFSPRGLADGAGPISAGLR